jgi:hypothetical protein
MSRHLEIPDAWKMGTFLPHFTTHRDHLKLTNLRSSLSTTFSVHWHNLCMHSETLARQRGARGQRSISGYRGKAARQVRARLSPADQQLWLKKHPFPCRRRSCVLTSFGARAWVGSGAGETCTLLHHDPLILDLTHCFSRWAA